MRHTIAIIVNILMFMFIIEIEIMPANGINPIFHTVNNYTDSANRKLITVWVYPDDMTGLATVTIRGIARKRPGGRRIYGSWAGKPNVKWERTLYVDSNKPNTTPSTTLYAFFSPNS